MAGYITYPRTDGESLPEPWEPVVTARTNRQKTRSLRFLEWFISFCEKDEVGVVVGWALQHSPLGHFIDPTGMHAVSSLVTQSMQAVAKNVAHTFFRHDAVGATAPPQVPVDGDATEKGRLGRVARTIGKVVYTTTVDVATGTTMDRSGASQILTPQGTAAVSEVVARVANSARDQALRVAAWFRSRHSTTETSQASQDAPTQPNARMEDHSPASNRGPP